MNETQCAVFQGKPDRIRLRLDRASLIEAAARPAHLLPRASRC